MITNGLWWIAITRIIYRWRWRWLQMIDAGILIQASTTTMISWWFTVVWQNIQLWSFLQFMMQYPVITKNLFSLYDCCDSNSIAGIFQKHGSSEIYVNWLTVHMDLDSHNRYMNTTRIFTKYCALMRAYITIYCDICFPTKHTQNSLQSKLRWI